MIYPLFDYSLCTDLCDSIPMKNIDHKRLDLLVLDARKASESREKGYRERALKIYPWICGRCAREFTHGNLSQLTVHHRDHNHDNNPADGSNWSYSACIVTTMNIRSRWKWIWAIPASGMPGEVGPAIPPLPT